MKHKTTAKTRNKSMCSVLLKLERSLVGYLDTSPRQRQDQLKCGFRVVNMYMLEYFLYGPNEHRNVDSPCSHGYA